MWVYVACISLSMHYILWASSRAPFRVRGTEQHSWERLPLAAVGATILMVIRAAPLFFFDLRQKHTGAPGRQTTAWITQLNKFLDLTVLPSLPSPFGLEYCQGYYEDSGEADDSSARLSPQMLYDLASALNITASPSPSPHENQISLPMPLFPFSYTCPECDGMLKYRKTGRVNPYWISHSSHSYHVPVLAGICTTCETVVYPDRYTRAAEDESLEDVLHTGAEHILIGKGHYASRSLASSLAASVIHAHIPISTFATCWNTTTQSLLDGEESASLSHKNLWHLFVLHHALQLVPPNSAFVLPCLGDDAVWDDGDDMEPQVLSRDEIMVKQALLFFPSSPTGPYQTFRIPGTDGHKCTGCAHFHRSFLPDQGLPGCTEDELLAAHQNAATDRTRVVTSAVIDGIEKISHKVLFYSFVCYSYSLTYFIIDMCCS